MIRLTTIKLTKRVRGKYPRQVLKHESLALVWTPGEQPLMIEIMERIGRDLLALWRKEDGRGVRVD